MNETIQLLEAVMPYWDGVDIGGLTANVTGGTAVSTVSSFGEQVHQFRLSTESALDAAPYLRASGLAIGTLTNTAHHLVASVPNYDLLKVQSLYAQSDERERYARKFEKWDSDLGRMYRQVLQTLSRTTSYPNRSVLPDIRQAFDYLLRKLVPDDDEVKKQTWFPLWGTHGDDPNKVSTRQKLRFAAEQYVRLPAIRATLIDNSDNTLQAYYQLSSFHAKGNEQFNEQKAKAALEEMLAVLNLWADGLGL